MRCRRAGIFRLSLTSSTFFPTASNTSVKQRFIRFSVSSITESGLHHLKLHGMLLKLYIMYLTMATVYGSISSQEGCSLLHALAHRLSVSCSTDLSLLQLTKIKLREPLARTNEHVPEAPK